MKNKHQVIVLIGFKHTGKSLIGQMLAEKLKLNFVDVDKEIEKTFQEQNAEKYTCRKIMQVYGEMYFRGLEKKVFSLILKNAKNSVIATGGGTIIHHNNQSVITDKKPFVIHVNAFPDEVFKRIMKSGRPAFFSKDNERSCFDDLWKKREKIYKKFADLTVLNNDTPEEAVDLILQQITLKRKKHDA